MRRSPVCGGRQNGVFLRKGFELRKGETVALYPGEYRAISPGTKPLRWSVTVDAFPGTDTHWILDASKLKLVQRDGVGHLLNSSHPSLSPPYDVSNCVFTEERPELYNPRSRPPLVFISAICNLVGPVELLVDYHWLLNGMVVFNRFRKGTIYACACDKCK